MSQVRQIAWSTIVQYGGKVLQLGFGIVAIKVLSNFFSEADFSEYLRIIEYCLFFSVAANLGLFANVVKKMSDAPKDGKLFTNALLLRLVTAVVFFLLGLIFIPVFVGSGLFLAASLVFLTSLLFDYVTAICDAMLQANYLMGRATFALIFGRIVNVVVLLFLIKGPAMFASSPLNFEGVETSTGADVPLLFLAPLMASLVTMGLSMWFVRRQIDFHWRVDKDIWRDLIVTGLPFGIVNIVNNLYFRFLPQYLANNALPKEQFATFDISYRIAFVLSLFSTFLMFSVMPAFRQSVSKKEWQKARKLFKRSLQLLVTMGVLLVSVVSFLAPWVISTFTDKKYFVPDFWFVLPMFLVLAAVSYLYDLILITLYSSGREWWLLKRELVALVVAGGIFSLSLIIGPGGLVEASIQTRLMLIIIGAIAGEAVMVAMGTREMRRVMSDD